MIRPQSVRTNAPGAVRCYVMVADAKSGASSLQDGSHGADVEGSLCDHPPQHHRAPQHRCQQHPLHIGECHCNVFLMEAKQF